MKKFILSLVALVASVFSSFAQFNTTSFADELAGRFVNSEVHAVLNRMMDTPTYSNSSFSGTNTTVVYQNGYTRRDGTPVRGHYKTKSNHTNWDNFSTQGNVNTYTGTVGSVARDYSVDAYNYGSGHTIYTGSRGGQYYINSNGNKTYVPKRRRANYW